MKLLQHPAENELIEFLTERLGVTYWSLGGYTQLQTTPAQIVDYSHGGVQTAEKGWSDF